MADKFINDVGLGVIKQWIEGKFALDSDLDELAAEVAEIIAEGGEPNVIEIIKKNGTAITPDSNKAVDIPIPTITKSGTGETEKITITDGQNAYDAPTVDAMEDYVSEHGGVIQKIKNNGTEMQIDSSDKSVNFTNATTSANGLMSSTDKSKLDGVETGAEANVQSDWSQTTSSADDFIKNKPTKLSDFTNDGDGTTGSAFATEDYVDTYGGKIDKIKVNNVEQTITNKTVDITVPEDLSDLTNTGADPYAQMSDVESAVVGALKPKGSCAFASLPQLTAANLNSIYNITDAFTTTADFVEGAGKAYPAGTNVAIINTGTDANPVYKYDVYSSFIDLSAYWTSTSGQNNTLLAMTTAEINAILEPTTP